MDKNIDHLKDGIPYAELKILTDKLKSDAKLLIEEYLYKTGLHVSLDRIGIWYDIDSEAISIQTNLIP